MHLFCNSRIHVITLYSGYVCVYYVSMLRCWHLVWILVRIGHPCLRVRCHRWTMYLRMHEFQLLSTTRNEPSYFPFIPMDHVLIQVPRDAWDALHTALTTHTMTHRTWPWTRAERAHDTLPPQQSRWELHLRICPTDWVKANIVAKTNTQIR
jgi:hypothetical protein